MDDGLWFFLLLFDIAFFGLGFYFTSRPDEKSESCNSSNSNSSGNKTNTTTASKNDSQSTNQIFNEPFDFLEDFNIKNFFGRIIIQTIFTVFFSYYIVSGLFNFFAIVF